MVSNGDIDNPQWSPDGKYVYYNEGNSKSVLRVRLNDRKVEKIRDLTKVDPNASHCGLDEISSNGTLLIACWFAGGDVYGLDLEAP